MAPHLIIIFVIFFTVSCSGVGSENTSVSLPPSYSVSNKLIEFGAIAAGTSKTETVTIKNTGNTPINGLTISTLSGALSRNTTCTDTLNANMSCYIQITFTPTSDKAINATLDIISSNAGNKSIDITGIGTITEIIIDNATLAFGNVEKNQIKTLSATLTNIGSSSVINLTVSALSGEFSRTTTCTGILEAGKSCGITVTFTPVSHGEKSLILDITSANAGNKSIGITGYAIAPELTADHSTLSFGDVVIGANRTLSLNISNTGDLALTGLIVDTLSGEFSSTTNCTANLNVGTSCNVTITFTPTTHGNKTTTLRITSADAGNKDILLTAQGIAAILNADTNTLIFGDVEKGNTKTMSIILTNNGNASVAALTIGMLSGEFSRTTTCSSTLDANTACNVTVTFAPSSINEKVATLNISSTNAGNKSITLTARGIAGAIDINKSKIEFGAIAAGFSKTISVTLTNTGNAKASGITINNLSGEFSRTTTCTDMLNSGSSCDISVTFTPSSTGSKTATLNITSSNAGNKSIPITGNGTVVILELNKTKLEFGDIAVGSSKKLSVTLTNNGSDPATGLSISSVDGEFSRTTTCSTTLAAGGSCDIEATLTISSAGDKLETIIITAENTGSKSIFLAGTWTGFDKIVTGTGHTIAKTETGKLYSWGNNYNGELATGDTDNKSIPTAINFPVGVTAFTDIYSGSNHSMAKGNDGKLYAWGYNRFGQLGLGSNEDIVNIPTLVIHPNGVSSFTEVYIGEQHTIAKGDNGILYAWGTNRYGELGIDSLDDTYTPTAVILPSGVTTFTDVYIGQYYTLAKGDDGRLYAWGMNYLGQLGIGSYSISTSTPTPVILPPGATAFTEVYTYDSYTIAKCDNGKIYTWGNNTFGELGIGDVRYTHTPTSIIMPAGVTSFTDVYTATHITLTKGNDGQFYAWGVNKFGQLGIGYVGNQNIPTPVILPAGVNSFMNIYPGNNHMLAKGDDGKIYAWGMNLYGKLGTGESSDNITIPTQVILPTDISSFTEVYIQDFHTMARGNNGQLYSWGLNGNGQLGIGSSSQNIKKPVMIHNPTGIVLKDVYPEFYHNFAVGHDGKLYAWGWNEFGQLGTGNNYSRHIATPVVFPNGVSSFTDLYIGERHTFAKGNDGKLYAWGANDFGQLGVGSNDNKSLPTLVVLPDSVSTFTEIHLGKEHTIAKSNNGKLYAWGRNNHAQLGIGTVDDKNTPTSVILPNGISSFNTIYSGSEHTLAKSDTGKLYAWGSNEYGQLGTGDNENKTLPTEVRLPAGASSFTDVYAGSDRNMAKCDDGKFYAWGRNEYGKLGTNDIENKNLPTRVIFPAEVTSFSDIFMRLFHTLVKGNDGKLYAWGWNVFGNLGTGDITDKLTPTLVILPTGITSFTNIYQGEYHTLAKTSNGELYAWGYNNNGELGIGSNDNKSLPTRLPLSIDANSLLDIYTNGLKTHAKSTKGRLYAWGYNWLGELALGHVNSVNTPTATAYFIIDEDTTPVTFFGLGFNKE